MRRHAIRQRAPPCGDPGLRAAKQLVAAEQHQIDTGPQAGLHGRFVGDAEG